MNDDTRYPVADAERATVEVLSRTPLLCTLDRTIREAIGREVRRGTAQRLSEDHRERRPFRRPPAPRPEARGPEGPSHPHRTTLQGGESQ